MNKSLGTRLELSTHSESKIVETLKLVLLKAERKRLLTISEVDLKAGVSDIDYRVSMSRAAISQFFLVVFTSYGKARRAELRMRAKRFSEFYYR